MAMFDCQDARSGCGAGLCAGLFVLTVADQRQLTSVYLRVTRKHVEKQNVTLSIPKAVLREAKHLAVDRGVSLSGFLIEALEERVKRLSEMRRAAKRQRALMRRGLKLGTKGEARWTREDLHAR